MAGSALLHGNGGIGFVTWLLFACMFHSACTCRCAPNRFRFGIAGLGCSDGCDYKQWRRYFHGGYSGYVALGKDD